MSAPVVFISYRREDSAGQAGRLFDRLTARLGRSRVFRDVDDIRAGEDFIEAVRERLSTCTVMLVLIGPRWLAPTAHGRSRLDDPDDTVRFEIVSALERGIRIVPVLLSGATMPRAADLPAPLAPLTRFNAVDIRDTHFDRDAAHLVDALVPTRRQRLRLLVRPAPLLLLTGGAAAVALLLWLSPSLTLPAERARTRLAAMGLPYDPATFVQRAREDDVQAVTLFLQAGMKADATEGDSTALEAASEEGHLAVVKALVEGGADVTKPLQYAAREGRVEVIDVLLNANPTRDAIGSALSFAAEGGHAALVRTFLDAGADVNYSYGGTALMTAAYYAHADIVQLLLDRGADVRAGNGDNNNETALHYATRSQSPSAAIVEAILRKGADVNAGTTDGITPLMNALEHGDVVRVLLAHRADVTRRTSDGNSALLYAAARNVPALVKPFVERGADVNAQNDRGWTALMWATGAGDIVDKPELVTALLDNGADPNLADRDGWTALMFAAKAGNTQAIKVLVGRGANRALTNKDGDSALTIARQTANKTTIALVSGGNR